MFDEWQADEQIVELPLFWDAHDTHHGETIIMYWLHQWFDPYMDEWCSNALIQ